MCLCNKMDRLIYTWRISAFGPANCNRASNPANMNANVWDSVTVAAPQDVWQQHTQQQIVPPIEVTYSVQYSKLATRPFFEHTFNKDGRLNV